MSESKSRPSGSRGRGSNRGGRGGQSGRGRGGRFDNGRPEGADTTSFEDEGEIGELKSKYRSLVPQVKEVFPDWTDEDVLYALQETDGDLQGTIERIASGNTTQWGEVKKKTKDRSQSKQLKEPTSAAATESSAPSTRGRGRGGSEGVRGGRGRGSDRGSDRGRGGTRGGRGARGSFQPKANGHASGSKEQADMAPSDTAIGGWDTVTPDSQPTPLEASWENVTAEQAPPTAEETPPATKAEAPKSWASIFQKPKPAPPPKASKAAPSHEAPIEPSIGAPTAGGDGGLTTLPSVAANETSEIPLTPPTSDLNVSEPAVDITPPKDDLTEDNLDKLPDESKTISATAASTAASTIDQRVISGTPLAPSQRKTDRPPMGGYATSAYKATGLPGRTASYQRKIMEQQEAVVMPGKHAVDKAAVQFGSMGLNGAPEDLDVDSDREDAETRAQPPQHSPNAPRASLPPAPEPKLGLPPPQAVEPQQTPRQAPGLPPLGQPPISQQPNIASSAPDPPPVTQSAYNYNQYGDRYAQPSSQPETSIPTSKPYEPFGQQLQHSHHYDPFNAGYGGLSSDTRQALENKAAGGSGNISSYYPSDEQRSYGGFGHPSSTGPESGSLPRTSSAIGSSAQTQTSHQPTAHGRFGPPGDAQGSGHSTPYSSIPTQQSGSHPHGSAPGQQQHGGYGYSGYPYGGYSSYYGMNQMANHPYGRERQGYDERSRYEDPYSAGFGYGSQSGYGGGQYGGPGGKGIYGQQHGAYGMTPTSHDQHSSSPAPSGAFGQQLPTSGRDSAVGGLSGYGGRSGSTQPSDNLHSGNQSNMPDVFGRSTSGNQGQGQNQNLGSYNEDSLRAYGDSKVPGGPSPALGQAGGRPSSAVNPQTGLPPQDARSYVPSGYGYGGHQSQYGSGPNTGAHGSGGQNPQYGGGYGSGYGGNYYGGNNNRGGWGAASFGH